MKKDIHPSYGESIVRCACGETFKSGSVKGELKVEICSKCHPFYTGRQKLVDSGGRVDKFKKRYDTVLSFLLILKQPPVIAPGGCFCLFSFCPEGLK